MAKPDDWMDKTRPGKRKSAYTETENPRVKPERGNIAEVIRERNRRMVKKSR